MTSLETLLRNPYASKEVTDTRLVGAALVIIPKYTAINAGGEYTTVIDAIIHANKPMLLKIGDIKTGLSFDKGLTRNRVGVADDFKSFVSKNHILVQAKYIDTPNKILEFYVDGMKEFNAGNKSSWVTLMNFYATAANNNSGDFPTQFVTDANAFAGNYSNASDDQSTGQTNTGTDRATRNTLRTPLEDALWAAMHTCFIVTKGNIDAIKAVVDLKSLEPQGRTEIKHFDSDIMMNSTTNLMHETFDISYVFLVRNTGTTDLRVCLAPDATTGCTAEGETLRGGKSHTFLAPTLGPLTNQFFNITNLDLTTKGLYEIEVYRS